MKLAVVNNNTLNCLCLIPLVSTVVGLGEAIYGTVYLIRTIWDKNFVHKDLNMLKLQLQGQDQSLRAAAVEMFENDVKLKKTLDNYGEIRDYTTEQMLRYLRLSLEATPNMETQEDEDPKEELVEIPDREKPEEL